MFDDLAFLLVVLLIKPDATDVFYEETLTLINCIDSKHVFVSMDYDVVDGSVYSFGVRHEAMFLFVPWDKKLQECKQTLTEYLQKINPRSLSSEEGLPETESKSETIEKEKNERERKERERKEREKIEKEKIVQDRIEKENVDSGMQVDNNDDEINIGDIHMPMVTDNKSQNIEKKENIDNKQIRKVKSRGQSMGSIHTNIQLSTQSRTPDMISRDNVSNSKNDNKKEKEKEGSAESQFSSGSNDIIITDFKSKNVEVGEIIDESIDLPNILVINTATKLTWNVLKEMGVQPYIVYHKQKVKVLAPSMYIFVFCFVLFSVS